MQMPVTNPLVNNASLNFIIFASSINKIYSFTAIEFTEGLAISILKLEIA